MRLNEGDMGMFKAEYFVNDKLHQIIGYHHETVQFAVSFSVLYTQFPKEKGNIIADNNTLIQDPF